MEVIYARQSIDKKDSISIESQIEKCKQEVNNPASVKIYMDRGFSGKNTDRPQFIEMMNDIKNGAISKVVVYKIDRISRAIVDFGKIMELFNKHNVEFVSYTEKFDTTSPIGNAMLNIVMVFAQLERETIQMRIKDNYYERGKNGYYLGGRAPYGFNKVEAQLNGKKTYTFEENEEQSAIVKQLYYEYVATDTSLGKLVEKLNNEKVFTNFGNPWSGVSLGRLLRNPVFVKADADVYLYLKNKGATINNDISEFTGDNGCYVYAERHSITTSKFTDLSSSYVTLGLHEGIIEPDLWLKCQYKLDENKQVKNSGKGNHSWLSGIMKCGYCGYAINVVNNCRGHNYINCGGRKLKVCYDRKKVIKLNDIENVVKKSLLTHIKEYQEPINAGEEDAVANSAEINRLKIKHIQIDEKINNLINAIADGNSTIIKYANENIEKLDAEKIEINKKIDELTKLKHKRLDIDFDMCLNNWDELTLQEKKYIAKAFIKEVTVSDDSITINY